MEYTIARHASPTAVREKLFEEIYKKAFPYVAAFVSHMNGSLQDAKDIFQDSVLIFFEKSESRNFTVSTMPERYILGIAKHLWLKKYKDDTKTVSLTALESSIFIPPDFFPTPQSGRLLQFLEATGKRCLNLLRGFYYEKQTMRDIANTFGYSSEHSATVQKYKCLEKIRGTIKETSFTYEDFFE